MRTMVGRWVIYREERVSFFSEGKRIAGILRLPDSSRPPTGVWPAVVQGPGWLGLKDAKLYLRYHEALTEHGFAVLIFDYRGFGDSEGSADLLRPEDQLEDLVNAVTYLTTRDDIDSDNIGVFGSGGTGGGNALLLAAQDPRVICAVSQVPVADGRDWLHRMRREHEWHDFLRRIEKDRTQRVLSGDGEHVSPRHDIMVPTPERKQTNVKGDVDGKIQEQVLLRSAEYIFNYRPIDVVAKISPRAVLIIAVENDATTPTDHAVSLYETAGEPKKLIIQRHTTHYTAYEKYGKEISSAIVDWFLRHMSRGSLEIREGDTLHKI